MPYIQLQNNVVIFEQERNQRYIFGQICTFINGGKILHGKEGRWGLTEIKKKLDNEALAQLHVLQAQKSDIVHSIDLFKLDMKELIHLKQLIDQRHI